MPVPTPEELQTILGIHPDQVMAARALTAAANGGAQPENSDVPPPDAVAPKPRAISAGSPAPDAAPVEMAPRPSLIPRPGPRALDVPPVGSPGPVENSVVSGADAQGRPTLVPRGPNSLPVGAVPPAPKPAPGARPFLSGDYYGSPGFGSQPENPVDMTPVRNLMTTPIRPISGDQARENTDRAELDRLRSTGSGVDQFSKRHHILGPIVKGLTIAGSALAPGVAQMVPGTDLHHQMLERQQEGRVAQDIGTEKAHSQMALSEEAQASRENIANAREQSMKDKLDQQNQKFVAGSEHEDANSPTGYVAQTIGGEWKPFTPPQSYRETKGEVSEAEFKQRQQRAKELNLTGDELKFFMANGKLREPNPNQSQIDEDRKARLQRQREHDQDSRMAKYNAEHERWAEHKSGIEKDQEAQYSRVENDWRKKYADVLDKKDTDPEKQAAMADLERQKKLIEGTIQQRFKELGPEPALPRDEAAPAEGAQPPASSEGLEQPIASVRTPGPAPIGGQVQQPEKPAKPSPAVQATPKPGDIIGPAPAGSKDGRTGTLPDGKTKVIVKNGQIVAQ